mmetsp:Transcript_4267/g.7555  ORF Transcript_4267/g.7555 Transcript_4267/m.7555 type:complete len:86 (+) Transcript_4267:33-290(+)
MFQPLSTAQSSPSGLQNENSPSDSTRDGAILPMTRPKSGPKFIISVIKMTTIADYQFQRFSKRFSNVEAMKNYLHCYHHRPTKNK